MERKFELATTRNFNGLTLNCYCEAGQEDSGDFWATREQIGRFLGYNKPGNAITYIHKRNKERLDKFSTSVNLTSVEGSRTVTREVTVYNFKGLLEICRFSNQPVANQVRENKLLCSRRGLQYNKPTQRAIEQGLFNLEIRNGFSPVTMVTPKGLQHLACEMTSEQYPLLMAIETEGD